MNRPGKWRVEILPAARRELLSFRNPIRDRIRAAVRSLGDEPLPVDTIAMRGKGNGLHRLRVGAYRVVYRIHANRKSVLVIRIGHRSEVYRGWESL